MSTISTGMDRDTLEELAAVSEVSGAEVSEEILTEAEAQTDTAEEKQSLNSAYGVAVTNRQLRELAKLQEEAIDHSIFETKKLNEGERIRYTTTFDRATLFNSINSKSEPVASYFGQDITVENIVITTAQVHEDFNDDFSEREDKPCVHFFCKDGLHLASVSNGILRSAENLITCAIVPSPEEPIVIRFKEITTKRGKAHSFDLIKG